MRLHLFTILLGILTGPIASHVKAQDRDSLAAAINSKWKLDSAMIFKPKKVSFDFILDNRHSFIREKRVDIVGFNAGVIFRDRFRIGAGWYTIQKDVAKNQSSKNGTKTTFRDLELEYFMLNFEYWLIKNRWVELAIPLEVGFGSTSFVIRDQDNITVIGSKDGLFVPSGFGLQVKVKPLRWVGITALFGYRKSLKTYDINADFDGTFFSYGVSVFIGNILTDIRFAKARKRHRTEIAALH